MYRHNKIIVRLTERTKVKIKEKRAKAPVFHITFSSYLIIFLLKQRDMIISSQNLLSKYEDKVLQICLDDFHIYVINNETYSAHQVHLSVKVTSGSRHEIILFTLYAIYHDVVSTGSPFYNSQMFSVRRSLRYYYFIYLSSCRCSPCCTF